MILDEIVSSSQRRAADLPGSFHSSTHIPVSLKDAILKGRTTHTRPIIAELKFASPSRGIIRPVKNPVEMATDMVQGGCCALSVLTEPEFFSGCPTTIQAIRDQVTVPILRKDFIVQEHQLDETRALGADAVLLITGILGEETGYFVDEAIKRGLEPLLEVHTRHEAKIALDTGAELIGVNNRDLRTFKTDLTTTMRIAPLLRQAGRTVVSLSGITWPCDIRFMSRFADGFLIGSAIMSSGNPRKRLEGLVYA